MKATSLWQMPHAATRTTTSPGPGARSPTSSMPSGAPKDRQTAALIAGTPSRNPVATECAFIQGDAEPRPVADGEVTIRAHPDRLGQHEVPPGWCPARRVEGVLEVRAATDAGGQVQVRQQADAVGPGVRAEQPALGEHVLGDRPC